MSKIGRMMKWACFLWALFPALGHAASRNVPDLDAWLYQTLSVSGKIVWEFPKKIPPHPESPSTTRGSPGLKGLLDAKGSQDSDIPSCGGNASCPIPVTATLGDALTLQWYYWPDYYKQRLRSHFARYWSWMEETWPLYRQYQASGFTQKPAGFDAKFASPEDPDSMPVQDPPPIVVEVMKDNFTHVLYDGEAAFDIYARGLALQLALELGDWLPWKMSDYNDEDLSILLDGRQLFRYVPAGAHPWGGQQSVSRDGYDAKGALPAPPLLEMKFLARSGWLRENRLATVMQLLEWERNNLRHVMGSSQDLTGECGKEFNEVYWGTKGLAPVSRMINGTVMACKLVPTGNGGTQNSFFNQNLVHWTGGCGGSAFFNHRVLKQINIPGEFVAFSHAQTRFSLEKNLLDSFLGEFVPQLPPEPAIDDGLPKMKYSPKAAIPPAVSPTGSSAAYRSVAKTSLERGGSLSSGYLSHADDPYGLQGTLDVPTGELLVSQEEFNRWFRKAPDWMNDEQKHAYNLAHSKYISLRLAQLWIHHIPEQMLKYYCYYDEPAGHGLAASKVYSQFLETFYKVEELDAVGFWPRLLAKVQNLGGCGAIPPLW